MGRKARACKEEILELIRVQCLKNGGFFQAAIKELKEKLGGISSPTLQRYINELEADGLLTIEHTRPVTYRVVDVAVPALDEVEHKIQSLTNQMNYLTQEIAKVSDSLQDIIKSYRRNKQSNNGLVEIHRDGNTIFYIKDIAPKGTLELTKIESEQSV
jgi:DNA-binding HxlR family transcriptional regulator